MDCRWLGIATAFERSIDRSVRGERKRWWLIAKAAPRCDWSTRDQGSWTLIIRSLNDTVFLCVCQPANDILLATKDILLTSQRPVSILHSDRHPSHYHDHHCRRRRRLTISNSSTIQFSIMAVRSYVHLGTGIMIVDHLTLYRQLLPSLCDKLIFCPCNVKERKT